MLFLKQKQYLLHQFSQYLFVVLNSLAKEVRVSGTDVEIKTTNNNIRSLIFFLKCHSLTQYKQLIDIACSDVPGKTYRFTVTYLLHSLLYNSRISLTIKTDEVMPIPSVIAFYESADWLEREVYDLFGIFFNEHPDLRRILTDYGFSGHPLRKDFPLTGFIEIYYNDSTKRMAYEKVELAQEFRTFTIQNTWVSSYKTTSDVKI